MKDNVLSKTNQQCYCCRMGFIIIKRHGKQQENYQYLQDIFQLPLASLNVLVLAHFLSSSSPVCIINNNTSRLAFNTLYTSSFFFLFFSSRTLCLSELFIHTLIDNILIQFYTLFVVCLLNVTNTQV